MDSRPVTADSKHNYQPPPPLWSRSTSSPSVPRVVPNNNSSSSPTPTSTGPAANTASESTSPPSSVPFPPHVDLLPILFPQQSSLYQAQLLQYNKLIAPGRGGGRGSGLQTPPLPPLLSAQNAHSGSRSRSSSKASNKDSRSRQGSQVCHGNKSTATTNQNNNSSNANLIVSSSNNSKGDRSHMTTKEPKMPPRKSDASQSQTPRSKPSTSPTSTLPAPHASNSVPSTPRQRPRKYSFESRDQSPSANISHSPRSVYSEANGAVPSLRPLPPRSTPCKYETSFKLGRRRIPYSIGTDPLERVDLKTIKSKLSEDEERKLTTDMREMYDRLQPTGGVESKRKKLVKKLEKLLNEAWPGHNIQVHLFGSSGNLLCSDDSDVDICITTPWKELEGVCKLAELLSKSGMEKVVCVASAKVPIVKIWDPELKLACDMNVNNTLALENTRMIRTYVEIDERVRPLAMILKYWTRQRIINDAAFGGTLSSYTWICMIIAFLQLRQPPVLPALHQRHHQKLPKKDGEMAAFADDLDKLRGFGDKNNATLGELLFQFFRFYAYEFDHTNDVLSIRLGKIVTKRDKNGKDWVPGINQLCVEEPFNTTRNLGNTADENSFRGLHMEFRQAFERISRADLDACCEKYVFPKQEERIFQKPPQVSRPVLVRSASQQHNARGGRSGNNRGGRQHGQYRNSNNNSNSRRASSSQAFDNPANMYMPAGYGMALSPQDAAAMYMPPQSSEQLAHTLNQLQLQENNLRFLQYTQSQAFAQHQAMAHAQRMQGNSQQAQSSSNERSRTNSFDTPPMSAPLRAAEQLWYWQPMHFAQSAAYYPQHGFTTYPASPSNTPASDPRRGSHRSSAASEAGQSVRSQSQPASRPGVVAQPVQPNGQPLDLNLQARQMNGVPIPSFIPDENQETDQATLPLNTPPAVEHTHNQFLATPSPGRRPSNSTNPVPAFGDMSVGQQGPSPSRSRLSSDHFPQAVLDRIKRTSRSPSPSPPGQDRGASSATPGSPELSPQKQPTPRDMAPLVVNGSVSKSSSGGSRQHWMAQPPVPGPTMAQDNMQRGGNPLSEVSTPVTSSSPAASSASHSRNSPNPDRPVIANGSTNSPGYAATHQYLPQYIYDWNMMNHQGHIPHPIPVSGMNGAMGNVPVGYQRFPKPANNPVIAQLDLETGPNIQQPNGLAHLSPVHETHTPSPVASRKADFPTPQGGSAANPTGASRRDTKTESAKGKPKPPVEVLQAKNENTNSSNLRVNGLVRENGHTRAAKSESDNTLTGGGWQKIPKGRKKGGEPRNKPETYPQSEQPPKNESERKGG